MGEIGVFTIPLASTVVEIVVLEPAPNMLEVLARKLAEAGMSNVRTIHHCVEVGLEMDIYDR